MSDGNFITAAGNGGDGSAHFGDSGGSGASALGHSPFISPADAIVAPGSAGSDRPDASDGAKRGPGRPRGSGTKTKASATVTDKSGATKKPVDAEGIAAILMTIHMGLSAITKIPEMEMEEEEAKRLASASEQVAKHYNVVATEKTLAWIHLQMVMAQIYGSRIIAFRLRKKIEKMEKQQQAEAASNVHTFRPAGA